MSLAVQSEALRPSRTDRAQIPRVSVIMTVRDGEATVARSIESILRQTLADWECVIIDDGSSDRTRSILSTVADTDSRISIVWSAGIGRGAALNLALAGVRAPVVANLDADDLSHPQRLEVQCEIMDSHRGIDVLSTDIILIGPCDTPPPVAVARRHAAANQDCNPPAVEQRHRSLFGDVSARAGARRRWLRRQPHRPF